MTAALYLFEPERHKISFVVIHWSTPPHSSVPTSSVQSPHNDPSSRSYFALKTNMSILECFLFNEILSLVRLNTTITSTTTTTIFLYSLLLYLFFSFVFLRRSILRRHSPGFPLMRLIIISCSFSTINRVSVKRRPLGWPNSSNPQYHHIPVSTPEILSQIKAKSFLPCPLLPIYSHIK